MFKRKWRRFQIKSWIKRMLEQNEQKLGRYADVKVSQNDAEDAYFSGLYWGHFQILNGLANLLDESKFVETTEES